MDVIVKLAKDSGATLFLQEDGATLVEYVLLVSTIGILAILAMKFLGTTASAKLNNAGTSIS